MAPSTYHGRPCRYGHGTLRLTANRMCAKCARLYGTAGDVVREPGAQAARAARQAAMEAGACYYHGQPCPLGHTLRYVRLRTRNCVVCTESRRIRRRQQQAASPGAWMGVVLGPLPPGAPLAGVASQAVLGALRRSVLG